MSDVWSREEVEAAVTSYIGMLAKERRGEPFNKAESNRALQQLLTKRTRGSIERKHQNISAILIQVGYPYIDGYKPLSNYQELQLSKIGYAPLFRNETLAAAVESPAETPALMGDLLAIQIDPPVGEERRARVNEEVGSKPPVARRNYLEIEARKQIVGSRRRTISSTV